MSKNQIKQNDHSFKWLPLVVLILTQIGTTGDNAVQSIATNSLIQHLGMSMNEIQLANIKGFSSFYSTFCNDDRLIY